MKTVFKSTEIAHIWAHAGAPEGRCPSSMSFQGASFYSYGTEIARLIEHKGQKAVLLNETGYSVTTSGHLSDVRRAIAGQQIFRIGGIGRGHGLHDIGGKELFAYAVEQSAECLKKADKARQRKDHLEGEAAAWLESASIINSFFGLRRKVDMGSIERLKASQLAAEKRERIAREKREARQREEMEFGYENWKDGLNEPYFAAHLFPVAFRVEADELVSTLGARVPLAEAKKAIGFALKHRSLNWHRNGETCPVGVYQLDAINPQGIVAGCHRITWDEVERVQALLA